MKEKKPEIKKNQDLKQSVMCLTSRGAMFRISPDLRSMAYN
jgi:hypothetical protein